MDEILTIETRPNTPSVYFPNLNGLRFLAAALVIVHHIEQIKNIIGYNNQWHLTSIRIIGELGVVLFFVLSGFLITYLLLVERQSGINLKGFYIRRILRIWPLYFLIIGLSLFVFPHIPILTLQGHSLETIQQNILIKVLLFAFFLPNLLLASLGSIPYASQSWSIGTEEQFYLIWPLLIKKCKNVFIMMFIIIGLYYPVKLALIIVHEQIPYGYNLYNFWRMFAIDTMALGGLMAAILFYKKSEILKILYNKALQRIVWVVVIIMILTGIYVTYIHFEFYACLFAILILNLSSNKNSIVRLENSVMDYLGRISYGIYMYHPVAIILSVRLLEAADVYSDLNLYLSTFILTIFIASLSYYFLEKRILRYKTKFSLIKSGEDAKPLF